MLIHIARIALIVLEVLLLFNLLIVVHELGHFLAARWRGLYIEKFGIWFGKPIWKKTINGVQYSLGTLPFGGFVALPQLAPMDIIEGKADVDRAQLPKISALDKIIVAFAGPLFSFLLAVVFAVIIWSVGRPVSEAEATTTIGYVLPGSPAAKAGLQAGDKILAVDHHRVARFGGMSDESIQWRIVRSEAATIPITIERTENGRTETKTVEARPIVPETKWWTRKGFREIGIVPAETPVIAKVEPGSPAAKAGLQRNDRIVAINRQPLYEILGIADYMRDHPTEPIALTVDRNGERLTVPFEPGNPKIDEVSPRSPVARAGIQPGDVVTAVDGQPARSTLAISDYITRHASQPITLSISRNGQTRDVQVTPEIPQDETVARIGIVWGDQFGITLDQYGNMIVKHPGPVEQIRASMLSIFNTVGAIASPKSDVRLQHMSGPVMMMQVYYKMLSSKEGWRMALWFSVVINVNLALINLLPIPVLDGGHILLALIEAVRRRPVSMRVLEYVQTACAVLIIGFMIYIAFFDVQDLFGFRRDTPKFSPKANPTKSVEQ
jgi:regulator of sigma E protease